MKLLTYPNKGRSNSPSALCQQASMTWAHQPWALTIYFGSDQRRPPDRGNQPRPSPKAHELGMATVPLVLSPPTNAFKKDKDYHLSADLTGQANHLGVTIEADIIKQKLPENNGRLFRAPSTWAIPSYGKFDKAHLHRPQQRPSHRLDSATRSPTATWGRAGLINSGGASGANDFEEGRSPPAVINKRDRRQPASSPARKSLPAPHEGRRATPEYHPGRLP